MIKPVDLQVILPRTVETQRIEPVRQGHIISEQQEKSRQAREEAKIQQQQVQTSEHTAVEIKVKDQTKNAHKKEKRGKNIKGYKRSGHAEQFSDQGQEHRIDIKI